MQICFVIIIIIIETLLWYYRTMETWCVSKQGNSVSLFNALYYMLLNDGIGRAYTVKSNILWCGVITDKKINNNKIQNDNRNRRARSRIVAMYNNNIHNNNVIHDRMKWKQEEPTTWKSLDWIVFLFFE